MKNIHLLPTDKPSILYAKDDNYKLANSTMAMDWYISSAGYKPYNIYITSDEKLPYNGSIFATGAFYHRDAAGDVHIINKDTHYPNPNFCSRIILTTDESLFKYGVQAIDDEFLEWFVKNPSCEEVEVTQLCKIGCNQLILNGIKSICCGDKNYKIIIPQEEPKPHSFCETPKEKCTMNYCDENGCQNRVRHLVEPKQETLEEASSRYFKELSPDISFLKAVEFGAKWQAERMYSEEEVLKLVDGAFRMYASSHRHDAKEWLVEQFKKK